MSSSSSSPPPARAASPAISASEQVDGFTWKSVRKAQRQKRSQGSSQFRSQGSRVELHPLPRLKDATSDEQELFCQKSQQGCTLFDFMDSVSDLKSKEMERAALNELGAYVSTNRGVIVESAYSDREKTISATIFRALPPSDHPDFDPEEDEPTLEASWPHIQVWNIIMY
jgi:serine/threonine-protein phosphatase 2A regulatory subunit B'